MDDFSERVNEWIKNHQEETLVIYFIALGLVSFVAICLMAIIPFCLVQDPACMEIVHYFFSGS